jgi:pimeloyl-ACP methyl ester carboxylesterase
MPMGKLMREGMALYFEEAGKGTPPLLFIHGLGGDHTLFAPQFDRFRREHRVVAIDLRGHGQSDALQQDYTVTGLADDMAWMCYELGLYQPVFVGHGMGGIVAVECAAQHPDLPAGVVALDAPLLPTTETQIRHQRLLEDLREPDNAGALRRFMEGMFLPQDDPQRKARILDQVALLPQWVALSMWESVCAWDGGAALAGYKLPLLYIAADPPCSDMARLRAACPQAMVGQTAGAGHFQLQVTGEVNLMMARFIRISAACPPAPAGGAGC